MASAFVNPTYRRAQSLANKISPWRDQEDTTENQTNSALEAAITNQNDLQQKMSSGRNATTAPQSRAYSNTSDNTQEPAQQNNVALQNAVTGGNASGKPWEAAGASKFAPRVLTDSRGTYLSEHGNKRYLANQQEVDDATKYQNDFWAQNPTGFQANSPGAKTNEEYDTQYADQLKAASGNWDTDGWGTPQYISRQPGNVMEGWSAENWDNPNMQTPKYVFGRIASNYDPNNPDDVNAMVAELQKAYPGAEFDGKDKLTIPGLGTIDVIIGAGAPGAKWGWIDLTNDAGTSGPLQNAIASAENPLGANVNAEGDLLQQFFNDPQWRERLAAYGIQI